MASSTFDSESDSCVLTNSKKYKCPEPGCKYSFEKPFKLYCHYRKHTNERPFLCDVENCTKAYAYSNHLLRHKNTAHNKTKQELLPCTVEGCAFKLANKYSLAKHIRRRHNPDRVYNYSCDVCNKGFHKKFQLSRHKFEHTKVHPFKCEKCGSGFLSYGMLNRHMRTHTTYECDCGEKFERYLNFLGHKKSCISCISKCEVCSKVFKTAYLLKKHMETHSDVVSEAFECDTCGREYYYKKNLIAHIRMHRKNAVKLRKACTYPDCGKTFYKNQNLNHHIKLVHSGIVVEKKPRNPRKDTGVLKGNVGARLVGLANLKITKAAAKDPSLLEQEVLKKIDLEVRVVEAEKDTSIEQLIEEGDPKEPVEPAVGNLMPCNAKA